MVVGLWPDNCVGAIAAHSEQRDNGNKGLGDYERAQHGVAEV